MTNTKITPKLIIITNNWSEFINNHNFLPLLVEFIPKDNAGHAGEMLSTRKEHFLYFVAQIIFDLRDPTKD